ncbi:MAG: translation elongation factor-like protein [Candidatus Marinimicrobia bacterium]|nr:translation elongation factor-like protein [Candidatus Neomarinimicrobiota bacterium]
MEELLVKEKEIGYVSNYFGKLSVAAIEITTGKLSVGDTIHIKGHTTDFITKVGSMQIEHNSVSAAKKGDSIGVKLSEKTRKKDKVFKVVTD